MKGIVCALWLVGSVAVAQENGGIPFHVDDPSSTTPNPPFRIFSPAKNAYARRIVTGQFTFVNDLNKIDPPVLKIFHAQVPANEIANKGGRFNPTDVGRGVRRRFVLAGNAPGIWFILYECGGIGYHHNLTVLSKNGRWQIVAAVAGFLKGKGDTFDLLKQALRKGEFFDQPGYPQY